MTAHFEINLLLSRAPVGGVRAEFLQSVFRELSPLLGTPQSVGINNYRAQSFEEISWSNAEEVLRTALPAETLLHVYGSSTLAGRPSVAIDESLPRAIVTISIPHQAMTQESEQFIDDCLQRLFDVVESSSDLLLVAGMELSLDAEAPDYRQLAVDHLQTPTSANIVIARSSTADAADKEWRVVRRWRGVSFLRRNSSG